MTHVILPQTFNCEHFDNGEVLLKTDYGIDCESDTHKSFRIFAGVMMLFYPIGVPAFFLAMMWPYRHELSDQAARESSYAEGKWLSFFCNGKSQHTQAQRILFCVLVDYAGHAWYFEICELLRKLVGSNRV